MKPAIFSSTGSIVIGLSDQLASGDRLGYGLLEKVAAWVGYAVTVDAMRAKQKLKNPVQQKCRMTNTKIAVKLIDQLSRPAEVE